MYDRLGRYLELITCVVDGCCVKYFFGSLAGRKISGESACRSNRDWRGTAAAMLYGGLELLGGSALLPGGGLWMMLSKGSLQAPLRLGITALLLFLAARCLYRQPPVAAAFMTGQFLAVHEIGAYLVHVVAMAGDGLNSLLLRVAGQAGMSGEAGAERLAQTAASVVLIVMYGALWSLLFFSLKKLASSFQNGELCRHRREMLFLMLPGLMGLTFCVLLRFLIFQGSEALPLLLYDQVPASRLLVPAMLALALFLLLSSGRRYEDILSLQKERNAALVL